MTDRVNGGASRLPDDELVRRAQNGDEAAASGLMKRYMGLVFHFAAMFVSGIKEETAVTKDDFVQYGLLGLCSAIRRYDTQRGASFSTFASVCVRNTMFTAAKKHRQELRGISGREIITESVTSGGADVSAETDYFSGERVKTIYSVIENRLTPTERQVTELFIGGSSYREIAQATGKSVKAVDCALQRARKKIAGAMDEIK